MYEIKHQSIDASGEGEHVVIMSVAGGGPLSLPTSLRDMCEGIDVKLFTIVFINKRKPKTRVMILEAYLFNSYKDRCNSFNSRTNWTLFGTNNEVTKVKRLHQSNVILVFDWRQIYDIFTFLI